MTQQAPAFKDGAPIGGMGRRNDFLPNTTDWLGRWRLAANASNDWHIDRAAQRDNVIYSGIDSIHLQDQAVTESMGAILDHTFEHLAPSDQMITRTRRRLLMAARALRDKRVRPPGVENVEVFRDARGGYFVSDDRSGWQDSYEQLALASHRLQPLCAPQSSPFLHAPHKTPRESRPSRIKLTIAAPSRSNCSDRFDEFTSAGAGTFRCVSFALH